MKLFKYLMRWKKPWAHHIHGAGGDFIVQRPHRKRRVYYYSPGMNKEKRAAMLFGSGICILLFSFSAVSLVVYAKDYFYSRQTSETLREIYYSEQSTLAATVTHPAESTPTPLPGSTFTPTPTNTSSPTGEPATKLEAVKYPYNPYSIISDRFQKMRYQNKDIIGWLAIDELLDEPVVQRDNVYYLDRDYRGYHNSNGAIFLDQNCDLSTRPYTYLLYGHNMKSGLMFGALRNYEDITFYRNNPFITFDTMYEDGRYVIFAVATVSTDPSNWRYVDFAKLHSSVITTRQEVLRTLTYLSKYECVIDVQPQDQLLLLVTCVGDITERRVIAARRIRENETEDELRRLVKKTIIR